MNTAMKFEFSDLQALLRFGHGNLSGSCFMLLNIADAVTAKHWLAEAHISDAAKKDPRPQTALQIAFSVEGLRVLGLRPSIINGFSDAFLTGMAGDAGRSRRLGDVADNAPHNWEWGGTSNPMPHLLLLLYAREEELPGWIETVETAQFSRAFNLVKMLPTGKLRKTEPFGFADGISQPVIDWQRLQSTDLHQRDRYSNLLATGEIVLGYPNEYGRYTDRPLIDPGEDQDAAVLPYAEDQPALRDFGRNGSYLVIRQLHQDVPGFWQYVDRESGSVAEKCQQLAAAMVGRERDGTPLVHPSENPIPGTSPDDHTNHFTYEADPAGLRCPIGSHIRRANPRTGDFPPGVTGSLSRMLSRLGFGQSRKDSDLIASTRFHRLLRRGRPYGPQLRPEEALQPDAPTDERGLQFIALMGNITRQFEFIQNAWSMSSTFGGVQQERDPLLGIRSPLLHGGATDTFSHPAQSGPRQINCGLPHFVTVRGGGYFFMPGLRALRYLSTIPLP